MDAQPTQSPPEPTSLERPPDHLEDEASNGLSTQQITQFFGEDFGCDSACSTPYVSAPSSPGRPGPVVGGFFYSCPPSPMHFSTAGFSVSSSPTHEIGGVGSTNEFEFLSGGWSSGSGAPGSSTMSSADELFLNGQIRPMKLSTHLESPQVLDPLVDLENEGEEEAGQGPKLGTSKCRGEWRGRDVRSWNKSRSRRTRSMSPLRSSSFGFLDEEELEDRVKIESFCEGSCKVGDLGLDGGCINNKLGKETSSGSSDSADGTTSRSSSAGRNSRRWEFLKDFLYRSKSEGRSNKFWSNISFSPGKDRKSMTLGASGEKAGSSVKEKGGGSGNGGSNVKGSGGGKKSVNGGVAGKRRGLNVSPHELHYKASRAQAEEMRKRTFLPYRQGLLGCLGFSSKGYGAVNGFARALNPVSSR